MERKLGTTLPHNNFGRVSYLPEVTATKELEIALFDHLTVAWRPLCSYRYPCI